MSVSSYRDLKVWQKAMDLVVECYSLAKQLPTHETYGLAGQIRRSAVSVPANIAEGHGRESLNEYLYHLSVANGSLMELQTHLEIAERLAYLTEGDLTTAWTLTADVGRMLNGLTKSLKTKKT